MAPVRADPGHRGTSEGTDRAVPWVGGAGGCCWSLCEGIDVSCRLLHRQSDCYWLPKGSGTPEPFLGLAGDTEWVLTAEAMKIDQNTVLQGKRATLVPYMSAHVPRYVAPVLL